MPNDYLDKVTINGTEYWLADSTARQDLAVLAEAAEDVYAKTEIQPLVTVTGYRLNESDGFCASNAGYKLFKFAVSAGANLRIVSDDRFQFQSSASVPMSGTSNRVGDTTYGTGAFDLTVPQTATYLIVSTPTVSAAKVYARESWNDDEQKVRSVLGESKYTDEAPFRGVNLFNWADAGNTWGQFRTTNGILSTGQNSKYGTSHLIYVKPGVTYQFNSASDFGNNRVVVGLYDLNKTFKGIVLAALDSETGQATFSVSEYGYAQINISTVYYQRRTMFCEAALFPDCFVEFSGALRPGPYLDLKNGVHADDLAFSRRAYSGNLFNPDGEIIENKYFDSTLVGSLASDNRVSSQYIPFQGAGTYCFMFPRFLFGTASKISAFGETMNYIGRFSATLSSADNNTAATFTASASAMEDTISSAGFGDIKYLGYTFDKSLVSSVMFVKDTAYPASYVPYEETVSLEGVTARRENAEFLRHQQSANLFNRWRDYIPNKRFNVGSSATAIEDDSQCLSQYIPFAGAGTYWMLFPFPKYGSASKIALLDKHKNKLRSIAVTKQDTAQDNTVSQPGYITVSDADALDVAYLGYTIYKAQHDSAMFVKASAYPSEYVPFRDSWDFSGVNTLPNAPNTLYRKKALFDGDSICAAGTDPVAMGAYAGRVADANEMFAYNYAVGGGTITSGLYFQDESPRHWVSANVDTMYQEHPDADYIILEGGTNDADVIGSILDGNTPAKFGAFDPMDFGGSYDDTTFCGAMDTLLYKAVNYWPKAKIGYVVAMRMGMSANFSNRYAYFQKAMEICKKWGVPCLNLWDYCHMNPRLTTYYDSSKTAAENEEAGKFYKDGQHPTSTGYDCIASIIENWMRTL